jgi:hypothetical protein
MKLFLTKSAYFFLFSILVSCSENTPINNEEDSSDLLESSTKSNQDIKNLNLKNFDFQSWKQYLEIVIEDRSIIPFKENGLKLVSYKELDRDESRINEILKNPFSSKSLIPQMENQIFRNGNSDGRLGFKLLPISKTEMLKEENDMDGRYNRKRSIIEHYRNISELQVVRLNWKYNGEDLVTYCIVNNKEVVYDDILSNLYIITIESSGSKKETKASTGTNKNPYPECPTSYLDIIYNRNKKHTYSDWSGRERARAEAYITITGTETTNCIKYINNYSQQTYEHGDYGFSAKAGVGIKNFRPAGSSTDGWCDYELGVAVSNSTSLMLSWGGQSFSISGGGGTMMTFGEYVTPDMLYE